jgi:ketosteroid isomerase-like protein
LTVDFNCRRQYIDIDTPTVPIASQSDSTNNEAHSLEASDLPEDVISLINKWLSTLKTRDVQARASLYTDVVDQFYNMRTVGHEQLVHELKGMYSRYRDFANVHLSNCSASRIQPEVWSVTFDKHFEATLARSDVKKARVVGDVQSQLIVRRFADGWKIISESDPRVYSITRSAVTSEIAR